MKQLDEYKQKIRNDDDLNRWKASWDGVSEPPQHVVKYMNTVVLPRLIRKAENFNSEIEELRNENKRNR